MGSVQGADWPCWRGPDNLGVSTEEHLPLHWSRDKNVAWTATLPGKGASSPVVVGDRVYVTTQTADTGLHVLAFDAAHGRLVWEREIGRGKLHTNPLHNMATPTPVATDQFVWAFFGTGDLACLDREGRVTWQINLVRKHGTYKNNHGMGTSPMLLDGKLYLACMQQGPSYLAAVDARSGAEVWLKDRTLGPTDEAQDSYSSPIILRVGGAPELVLAGAEAVTAYAPTTGDLLWRYGGLKVPNPYGRTISGPTAGEGVVIAVASGFQNQGYTLALKPEGHGDLPPERRLWTQRKFSPDCPTPLVYRGAVYLMRDDGIASCLDLQTGAARWQERLFTGNVKVSPVAGDGRVYFTSGQSECKVLKAGPTLEVLATNRLDEPTLATPALSHGRAYLRTEEHLYCVAD